jgi:ATP-dependent protease ClpP protease subunit
MNREYSEDFMRSAREMAKIGKIPVFGEFNDEMRVLVVECITIASKALLTQNKEWCTLIIDSGGGIVNVLNTLRTAMHESGLKYRGVVSSQAGSSAFMLLQYCNWRSAMVNSSIMFHYGRSGISNEDFVAIMENKPELVLNYHKIRLEHWLSEVSERSGRTREELHEYARLERSFIAQEAFTLGLLDEVISVLPKSEKPPTNL